jgi:hypothetical protein
LLKVQTIFYKELIKQNPHREIKIEKKNENKVLKDAMEMIKENDLIEKEKDILR